MPSLVGSEMCIRVRHKEIEKLINKKVADGELSPNANLDITANIKIDELGLNHSVSSTLSLPGKND